MDVSNESNMPCGVSRKVLDSHSNNFKKHDPSNLAEVYKAATPTERISYMLILNATICYESSYAQLEQVFHAAGKNNYDAFIATQKIVNTEAKDDENNPISTIEVSSPKKKTSGLAELDLARGYLAMAQMAIESKDPTQAKTYYINASIHSNNAATQFKTELDGNASESLKKAQAALDKAGVSKRALVENELKRAQEHVSLTHNNYASALGLLYSNPKYLENEPDKKDALGKEGVFHLVKSIETTTKNPADRLKLILADSDTQSFAKREDYTAMRIRFAGPPSMARSVDK